MANSIPEQISQITNQLTRLSHSLEEIKQKWEQENSHMSQKVDSLQARLREAEALNQTIRAQNQRLESRLAGGGLSERHTRQTLGIILREDLATANDRITHARQYDLISNSDVTENYDSVTEEEARESRLEVEGANPLIVSSSGTAEERSQGFSTTAPVFINASPIFPASSSRFKSPETVTSRNVRSESVTRARSNVAGTSTTISGTLPLDREPEEDSLSVSSTSHRWVVHINKPAASAKVKCGPIKWSQLPSKLNIDKQTINALKNLTLDMNLFLNLRIQDKFAFIYDPIFLDDTATPATYLFDWGKMEENESIARYILQKGELYKSTFHTFVYLLKPKRWYYIGVQEWGLKSLTIDIWNHFAEQRLRSRIIQRLQNHCGGKVEQNEIIEALDKGVLKQICVHLSGDMHMESSREMCRLMNYDPPAS